MNERQGEDVKHVIEPIYSKIGVRVAVMREMAGLTQEALGASLRPTMTRANIANIENGLSRLMVHTAVQIAAALGVELGWLLTGAHRGRKPLAAKARGKT